MSRAAFFHARRALLVVFFAAGAGMVLATPSPVFAQEVLVASVSTPAADPGTQIAPEQSIDLTSNLNPPLPVASTEDPAATTAATIVDSSGIPRRFQYRIHLSIRGVYDDNINLDRTNQISDFYTSIEPSITLGFGDIDQRTENYLRLDYIPAFFIFANHDENNSIQHVFRLEGQYRFSRLTLNFSQMIQIMDGVDIQGQDSGGGLDQQVNLDVAGRTRFNVYTSHLNAAYYLTGKTFLSSGVDFTANDYKSLISSEEFSANIFLNYNYSSKLVVGLGGTFGYQQVDDPKPDQNFQQINLRVSYQATGKLDFAASVGVEFRHFDGGLVGEHVSPVYEIAANYTPFDGTKITLSANRRNEASAVLAAQDYAVTNITLGIQQRLFQRIFLSVNGGYEKSDYFSTIINGGGRREDDYFFVQPSIAVSLTRFWTIGAYYLHRENSSSFNTFDFTNNQVGVRSTFEF